ncbi:hypothetical protein [Balneola vulgaris]|uniref:LuxE/PaaK family acyltransferase n=1 Tax=Balneola vulgaris TaxID=287535 RepID=UPI00036908C5|nr:hypothetical protein [Balneola vulgaris]
MNWKIDIFDQAISFEERVAEVFQYQYQHNSVYKTFCDALGVKRFTSIDSIPLLPIEAFKETKVLSAPSTQLPELYFQSSGTSGMTRSTHYIADEEIYRASILNGMREFFELDNLVIWGYTPGYAENPHSSLIWMIQCLIDQEKTAQSKFLPLNTPLVQKDIAEVAKSGKQLMIFGAAFGLLDLLEISNVQFPSNTLIMETGGMKTFKRSMSKEELHQKLCEGFDVRPDQICSEYGMSELLSQSYSKGDLWFQAPHWKQVSIRNPENPLETLPNSEEGLIGVIDLANVHSCSFLLTGDKGVMDESGRFQVLGRWNTQNLRGCNFLIDQD